MSKPNSLSDSEKKIALIHLIEQNHIKVINFIGYSKSGKTTSIESLIKWLKFAKSDNINIAVVKNIAHNDMMFDIEGKNTFRYSQAGADVVVAKSNAQSIFFINNKLDLFDIISQINLEFESIQNINRSKNEKLIILEGFRDFPVPSVLAIRSIDDIKSQFNDKIKCFVGAIGSDSKEINTLIASYKIPYIDCTKEPEKLYITLFGSDN